MKSTTTENKRETIAGLKQVIRQIEQKGFTRERRDVAGDNVGAASVENDLAFDDRMRTVEYDRDTYNAIYGAPGEFPAMEY